MTCRLHKIVLVPLQTFNGWDITLCVKKVTDITYNAVFYDKASDKCRPVTTVNILHNMPFPSSGSGNFQDSVVNKIQGYLDGKKETK